MAAPHVLRVVTVALLLLTSLATIAPRLTASQAATPATAVPTAPHPTPASNDFDGCPAEGQGPDLDTDLNRLKNRIDEAVWQPITLQAMLTLAWPEAIEFVDMNDWDAATRAEVAPHNGVPVQIEGVLLRAVKEGKESPNCRRDDPDHIDYHLWLASDPHADRGEESIVVEVTPRVRANHPGWSIAAIQALIAREAKVRIGGWTMIDPAHPDQVHHSRGTIWEIHPVMRFEVQLDDGTWIDLDDLPTTQFLATPIASPFPEVIAALMEAPFATPEAITGVVCTMDVVAVVRQGPSAGQEFSGALALPISPDGRIEAGAFVQRGGPTVSVEGQVTGRAVNLLVAVGDEQYLSLVGTAEEDLAGCDGVLQGAALGPFSGPLPGDLGDWRGGS